MNSSGKHNQDFAQYEMPEQAGMYDAMFQQAMSCFALLDRNYNFIRVNEAFANYYGKKAEEFVGRKFYKAIPYKGIPDEPYELFDQVLKTKQPLRHTDYPYIFEDQPERGVTYWDSILQPLFNEQGEVEYFFFSSIDVTERKRAEDALKESERKLGEAQRMAHVGYWDGVIDDDRINWSDETYRIFGFNPQEQNMSFSKLKELIHPEDREKVVKLIEDALRSRKRYDVEYRIIRPCGEVRVIHSQGDVTWDDSGIPRRIFGTLQDITESKAAENALHDSYTLLNTIIETVPDCIFVKDIQGRNILVNSSTASLLGKSVEDILGRDDMSLLPPETAKEVMECDRRIMKSGVSETFEETVVISDVAHSFLTTKDVFRDAQGKIKGLIGIARDISERKRAEDERTAHLHFFESMERINRAIQGTDDLEKIMSDVLDELLSIFDCDRAWLVYPCDPYADTWCVPMERTRPEYPGALTLGVKVPVDEEVAKVFQTMLASDSTIKFGPLADYSVPQVSAERFNVQSQIAMAIYPKVDKPYMLGLHQCSYARVWTPDEEKLFQAIGRRLADALSSLLMFRNLRESERLLSEAQHLASIGSFTHDLVTGEITSSAQMHKLIVGEELEKGVTFERFVDVIHPEDRQRVAEYLTNVFESDAMEFQTEYRVVLPGQKLHHILVLGRITRDETGKALRVFGTAQDITERKQAEETLLLHAERLQLLYTANLLLSQKLDMDELLEQLLDVTYKLIPHDGMSIMLLDDDGFLSVCAARGYQKDTDPKLTKSEPFNPEDFPLVNSVLKEKKAVLVGDTRKEPLWVVVRGAEHVLNWLGVPLMVGGKVIGICSLDKVQTGYFTEEHKQLAEALAVPAVVAIQNAQLHQQTQNYAQELELRIAEQKIVETELQKSNELMRAIIDAAPTAIIGLDLDGNVQNVWNAAAEEMLGWSAQEVMGRVLPSVPTDNQEEFKRFRERIRSGKSLRGVEVSRQKRDGTPIDYSIYASPLHDEEGKITGNIAVLVDITERRQAEKALRENEAKLAEAQEIGGFGSFEIDIATGMGHCSPALCRIYGFENDEPFQNFRSFLEKHVHPDDMERTDRSRDEIIAKGTSDEMDYRYLHPDGRERVLYIRRRAVKDADGRVTKLVGTVQDITERRETENRIRASEARFRTFVDHATDAFFIHDSQGKIVDANRQACESLGYNREELIGMYPRVFDVGTDMATYEQMNSRLEAGDVIAIDTLHKRNDGRVFPVELRVRPYWEGGERFSVSLARDITERKRAEEIMRSSLREKDVLLKEVHHRVKNNLQFISSLLSLQAGQIKDRAIADAFIESQNRVRAISMVHENLYRSNNFGSILFSSHIESLCAYLYRSYGVDPGRIVLKLQIDSTTLDLDRAIRCGLIINELVSNAIKHAFPDGKSGLIKVQFITTEDGKHNLTVEDNGIGLSDVFDPDNTETLGLQLVSDLTEQLNGKLNIKSHGGTTFTINFSDTNNGGVQK